MNGDVDWSQALPGVERLENEPMAKHTTFRIGGPARWFFRPKTPQEAALVLSACAGAGIRPFFLGNGSNLLVSDGGYDGVMLSTGELTSLEAEGDRMVAGGGVLLSKVAAAALDRGLTGLEFASGIPGSAGGAARMNAGAYGGEMAQVVEWVDCLDETGRPHRLSANDCRFSYRHSVFCRRPWLVTAVCFRLAPGDREAIRDKMAELNRRRREKQPLEYPSAGSTFKRPAPVDGVPRYAAALIEETGLKGLRVGDAQVSEKHSGFVVNRGRATCADVLALMEEVRARVLAETGVALEPEVEILA